MENAKEMQKLNDDMEEYLQYAKPGTSIVDELRNAFDGNTD